MSKKYELTDNTKIVYGIMLHKIRALKDFETITGEIVKAGDFGGWIEKESNLSQDGQCWVFDNAEVYGDAWVYDNAEVYGDARVYDDARVFGDAEISIITDVFIIGPAGSRDDFTTFYKNQSNGISVKCGCFDGSIEDFENAVKKTHGDNKHAKVYLSAAHTAKIQILEE